ncbi:hypothetical protein LDENG_00190900 [Lucifuga dentata]|nr:hypothetical protein LDENG_00190900 [Lucifuga dentata]
MFTIYIYTHTYTLYILYIKCFEKFFYFCLFVTLKGPYHPFCMFEPNIFNFHTRNVTDNHFPKHTTGTVN